MSGPYNVVARKGYRNANTMLLSVVTIIPTNKREKDVNLAQPKSSNHKEMQVLIKFAERRVFDVLGSCCVIAIVTFPMMCSW